MALIKSLTRFLSSSKPAPAVYLCAFGKHPGWNDHIDDLGFDTDSLVTAKRLLYIQGISQNIDSGAWEALDLASRLEAFRHDFLWHMAPSPAPVLLAGRLWASVDGKGRAKYPMALCAQAVELPDTFTAQTVLPFLSKVHEQCAAATTAADIRNILDTQRQQLRELIKSPPAASLTARDLAAVANHPDMHPNREGFHRIIYQFARGMSLYRPAGSGSSSRILTKRAEQIRVPICGLPPDAALLFWLRLALTLLDPASSILLFAPDLGAAAPWVDIIVGEPAPANLFCIKAGAKALPLTSDIPYTLDPSLVTAIDTYVTTCAAAPESAPAPPWPAL